MIVVLIAGIGAFLAGILAIGLGVPVKEFSFGSTLMICGAVIACTGMIMLSLWLVVRELKQAAGRFGLVNRPNESRARRELQLPPGTVADFGAPSSDESSALPSEDPRFPETVEAASPATRSSPAVASPPPWQDEASGRDRARQRGEPSPVSPAPETAPGDATPKPRRNLLFSSSSRKERERASSRDSVSGTERAAIAGSDASDADNAPRPTFEDAWPQSERSRSDSGTRGSRPSLTSAESSQAPAAGFRHTPKVPSETATAVTVLKSGVVDGMAYSLYSDGSIEAQMPEGMMRFSSIDDLRLHLDQRP